MGKEPQEAHKEVIILVPFAPLVVPSPWSGPDLFLIRLFLIPGSAVSNRYQHGIEGFLGNGFDERANEPSEPERNRSAQTDRFALNIDAPIRLFEAPIGIKPPQE